MQQCDSYFLTRFLKQNHAGYTEKALSMYSGNNLGVNRKYSYSQSVFVTYTAYV